MHIAAVHNSRLLFFRNPQGAVKCAETITLRIRIEGDAAANVRVRLRLWSDNTEKLIDGQCAGEDGERVFSFVFSAPSTPQLIWYYFIIDTRSERLWYGGVTGEGRLCANVPRDYQITVYDGGFSTPEWFRRGIIYQIFPDRFNRGAPDTQGRTSFERLEFHERLSRPVVRHKRWEELPLYLPLNAEADYNPCDYYGGDINGIIEKLDYLKTLGVSVIYLNPIFEAASNHRYNTGDYLSIDPALGDAEDARRLAAEAKKRGIHIMLDGVFSHTGDDSFYFNRYGNYPSIGAYQSKASPYGEWYEFKSFPNEYKCWWGFDTLPEVNENRRSYMDFIRNVLRYWAGLGFTSWRLDVADELPDEFIAFLRTELKSIDPDGVLLGEVWEDASNKTWEKGLRRYVYGYELDAVMNYPFAEALCGFLMGEFNAYALDELLSGQRERYPEPFYRACMNLTGSHDTYRILSRLCGAPPKDSLSRELQAAYQPGEKALELGKLRLKLVAIIQFAMPQPPCIYYGDEAGMTGLSDPFNRGTYPWGREDTDLLEHYMKLCSARTKSECLNAGGSILAALAPDVFAVLRVGFGASALAVINRSEAAVSFNISSSDFCQGPDAPYARLAQSYTDVLSAKAIRIPNGEGEKLTLAPLSGFLGIETY